MLNSIPVHKCLEVKAGEWCAIFGDYLVSGIPCLANISLSLSIVFLLVAADTTATSNHFEKRIHYHKEHVSLEGTGIIKMDP